MPNHRHHRVPGGTTSFTIDVRQRRGDTLMAHIDPLRSAVRRMRDRRLFPTDVWVVLPNQGYRVWTLPPHAAAWPVSSRRRCVALGLYPPFDAAVIPVRARPASAADMRRRMAPR